VPGLSFFTDEHPLEGRRKRGAPFRRGTWPQSFWIPILDTPPANLGCFPFLIEPVFWFFGSGTHSLSRLKRSRGPCGFRVASGGPGLSFFCFLYLSPTRCLEGRTAARLSSPSRSMRRPLKKEGLSYAEFIHAGFFVSSHASWRARAFRFPIFLEILLGNYYHLLP